MSDRYAETFGRLGNQGAFGAFVMLGDPDLGTSAAILDALVEGGADMLEVGIPFSDPVADGPTIQAAADRALRRGVTPAACFKLLAAFRERHPQVPVGVLTYANIVLARGRDAFYRACAAAGVDSVLVADAPVIEAEPFAAAARAHGIAPVLFRALADDGAPPPVLGFGISTPAHVHAALAAGAVGVISGSAIVKIVESEPDPLPRLRSFVGQMKAATLQPLRSS
jgi:tryptophan synthase alpha chain